MVLTATRPELTGAVRPTLVDGDVHTTFASGAVAKTTKQTINRQRIYPPRNGAREDLLAAAAPTVQAPPNMRR